MILPYTTWVILLLTIAGSLYGQDTAIYHQAKGALFSNQYVLVKASQTDRFGTFEQYSNTDDGQQWYGHGVFTESRRKIRLTFDTVRKQPRVQAVATVQHKDTLFIRWFDERGQQQYGFTIRLADSTQPGYKADWETGLVKIPKGEVKGNKLGLYAFGHQRKIADVNIDSTANEVNIFANDVGVSHTYGKQKEVLKKTSRGFITVGMWTQGRKSAFERINR